MKILLIKTLQFSQQLTNVHFTSSINTKNTMTSSFLIPFVERTEFCLCFDSNFKPVISQAFERTPVYKKPKV